jgi:CubicO group peptidase (beta-lactamase class C family)
MFGPNHWVKVFLTTARTAVISLASVAMIQAAPTWTPLSDYVGTYADGPKHKVEIFVDTKGQLVAVIDDASYPLRITGTDELTNGGGEKIPFNRGADGRVSGYFDDGKWHEKLSPDVSADTRSLFTTPARPAGEAYRYIAPSDNHDGIPVGDIAKTPLGVQTAQQIVAKVADGSYPGVHSVLLYQDGKLVMEEYFYGYNVNRQQQLRSATKSVVSTLAGIAIDHRALTLDTPALDRLQLGRFSNPDSRKAKITVRDFLTMRSGLACNDHSSNSPGRETVLDDQPDWIQAMYDLPQINDPGKAAFYCSGGVAVVGRVIEKSTGYYLPDYAARYLFKLLGIQAKDWTWNYDLTNKDQEYAQIHMRPRDMLKLGIVFANGGVWHGRRIVSTGWTAAALSAQSTVDGTGYGYFWWRPWLKVNGSHVYVSAAQGNGGQKIYVLPQYRLVAVFTGGLYNSSESPMNQIMATDILPKLIGAYPGVTTAP